MKTIKVIDLLNKIANGEEVPKRIIYSTFTYWYDEVEKDYYHYVAKDLDDEDIEYLLDSCFASDILNEEIQIIEDTPKEKKIPEKLRPTSLKGIDNLDEKIEIAHIDTISVIETLNQVIDYLKSKGDE